MGIIMGDEFELIFGVEDIKNMSHNLDSENGNGDFMSNYLFQPEHKFSVITDGKYVKKYEWQGKEIVQSWVCTKDPRYDGWHTGFGIALLIDGKVEVLLSIYEPHGVEFIADKNLIVLYGHEDIVLYWLDTKEHKKIRTR